MKTSIDSLRRQRFDCARHAAERAGAVIHLELGRGTAALNAIASSAVLLGIFGTVAMLMSALNPMVLWGCSYGCCAGGEAEAFVPLMLSLPVAIFASAGWQYLRREMETFDLEMGTATLDLLDGLGKRRGYPVN